MLSHVRLCTPWPIQEWNTPWNSPGQNTGVGNLSLLQGIFPTQGSNPGLQHCRRILYKLSHQGSPRILESGQPIPSLADLPNPGIKPGSPILQVDSLPTELLGKPLKKKKKGVNAVPHYQKLCHEVSHIWGNHRGQHTHSAMAKPLPGRTTFLIMVSPLPGKYELVFPLPPYSFRHVHRTHTLTLPFPRNSSTILHTLSFSTPLRPSK